MIMYIVDYDGEDTWLCHTEQGLISSVLNFVDENPHLDFSAIVDFTNVRKCHGFGYGNVEDDVHTLRELIDSDFFDSEDVEQLIDKWLGVGGD